MEKEKKSELQWKKSATQQLKNPCLLSSNSEFVAKRQHVKKLCIFSSREIFFLCSDFPCFLLLWEETQRRRVWKNLFLYKTLVHGQSKATGVSARRSFFSIFQSSQISAKKNIKRGERRMKNIGDFSFYSTLIFSHEFSSFFLSNSTHSNSIPSRDYRHDRNAILIEFVIHICMFENETNTSIFFSNFIPYST